MEQLSQDLVEVPLPERIEVDTEKYFLTSMTFDSKESVIEWARSTGISHGVVVIVRRSDLNDPNRTPRIMLGCERGGEYRGGNQVKKRRSSTKKCGCPFRLKAQLIDASAGTWGLFVINGLHNHSLVKVFEGHSFIGRLSSEEKNIVERLSKTGVKTREILDQLKLNNPTNVSTMKTVYNARTTMKIKESLRRTHMQQLFKRLVEYGYVSRHRSEPMTDVIQDLFWSSSESIQLARAFPFVFIMDCTYKTNKYRLLQIVGVTSTDKIFVVALCYMSAEKEENYCWALNCFRDIFDNVLVPSVFVTDCELALMDAIKSVFPDSKNLLCRVHVERNVLTNCLSLFPARATFDDFMKSFAAVMHSCTIDEYQKNVHILETTFHDYPKAVSYVIESWLNKYKECFVSAWIDKYFHVGNTLINRMESNHLKLKKYLTNSVSGFVESFEKIHLLIEGQILDIKASFEESLTRVPERFRKPLYKDLIGVVSIVAMDKIEHELSSIGSHVGVATNCSHNALISVGLPCAHLLERYRDGESPIPLTDIHKFWRKLNMTPFRADNEEEVSIQIELDIIANKFAVATLPQKLEIKRQLQIIGNATYTTLLDAGIRTI